MWAAKTDSGRAFRRAGDAVQGAGRHCAGRGVRAAQAAAVHQGQRGVPRGGPRHQDALRRAGHAHQHHHVRPSPSFSSESLFCVLVQHRFLFSELVQMLTIFSFTELRSKSGMSKGCSSSLCELDQWCEGCKVREMGTVFFWVLVTHGLEGLLRSIVVAAPYVTCPPS